MEIRRLRPEERFEADLISNTAFHMRMEDPEKAREKSLKQTVDDWGAFDEGGHVMARIINNRFESVLDGTLVRTGGIGAVSTLPEYRSTGAVRAIFSALLPDAYRGGEVFSTLYPFNQAFYRKFGYDTVCPSSVYRMPPAVLRDYRFTGRALQWKPGDGVGEYLDLFNKFSMGFNLAVLRDEERFRRDHFDGLYYRDRKFAYLLKDGEETCAGLIFQDVRHDPAAILRVEDLAWRGRRGFLALLGFLGRFSADYGEIHLPLPVGTELYSLIHSANEYDISKETEHNYMIRPVNAVKLLSAMRRGPGRFVIRIRDDLIPENNGVFAVEEGSVRETGDKADLSVDIRALGVMAAGSVGLSEAALREDVEILGNLETLEKVFVRKPVLVRVKF